MKQALFFLIICFSMMELVSQNRPTPPTLLFQTLTVDDGLSQATNNFIFKDYKGFVWMSSLSGLNRFDGEVVKTYQEIAGDSTSVKGQNINGEISESENGDLWFSSVNAINCYVRKDDNFRSFQMEKQGGFYFTCGLDKKGQLYFMYANQLYRFDIQQKTFHAITDILPNAQRGSIELDESGNLKRIFIYMGNGVNGLQMISLGKNGEVQKKHFFSGKDNLPPFTILGVTPENDSLIWMTSNDKLLALNPLSGKHQHYSVEYLKEGKKRKLTFNGLSNFDENYLIVATAGKGLAFFDKQQRQFSHFQNKIEDDKYSLTSNLPYAIYADKDKGVWVDFSGQSVDYAFPKQIKFKNLLSKADSFPNVWLATLFELPNQQTWVGNFNYNNYLLDSLNQVIDILDLSTHPEASGGSMIYHFLDQQNRVWLLNWRGLFYYDLNTKIIKKLNTIVQGFPLTLIHGIALKNGEIIFSNVNGGLFSLQTSASGELYLALLPNVNLKSAYTTFYQGSDNLIYANENLSNLVVFNEKFEVIKTIPIEATFGSFYDVPNDSIAWIGSDRGLIRYNKNSDKFRYFTQMDGLPNSNVYGIVSDDNGQLWLSTNAGLAQFDIKTYAVKTYGRLDGVSYNEFNPHSFLKKQNGQILFGSMNGLTAFHPDDITPTPYEATPQFTSIKINDLDNPNLKCSKTGAKNVSEIQALELDYDDNTLSFEFSAMNYGDAKKNQYRYKMEGVDDKWSEPNARNFARYPNLPSGKHTFQLHAANSDGNWNDSPKTLIINIIPPLTERTWFRSLLLFLLLGLFWTASSIYQEYKHGKRLALEKQKIFWARKMHEDLGADYASLKLRLSMLLAQLAGQTDLAKDTNRIAKMSEAIAKQIRSITWSLNYKNDSLQKLVNYLHEYAAKTFEDTDIDLHFPLANDLPNKILKGENRLTILHVFKEALNNIQKHAKATEVRIAVTTTANTADILIEDNGVGFDPSLLLHSSGNGLTNMQERLQEINGQCEIKTSPTGTIVRFSFRI